MSMENDNNSRASDTQINFRPSPSLLRELELYRKTLGFKSLPQAVYALVASAVDKELRERGLK